jgi:hypothetical protein
VNKYGRPHKIAPGVIEPLLRQMRGERRMPLKKIASEIGYSVDHLKKLCTRFGIRIRSGLKPQTSSPVD